MNHGTTYIGLDVHRTSITAAAVTADGELKRLGQFANTRQTIAAQVAQWQALGTLAVAYEAGPCGYPIARQLAELGIACQVIAPSLLPRKPGDRVKTDRRDAEQLAIALSKELVTAVPVPSPEDEGLRAVSRLREQASHDLQRDRQRLAKFLHLQGVSEPAGHRWTKRWWGWAEALTVQPPTAQLVLAELRQQVRHSEQRVQQITAQLETVSQDSPQAAVIARLQRFHGIGLVTAVGIVAECGDLRRFDSAPALMAYTGLVPSEHSSGSRQQRGGITRTGKSHLRFLLGEAAWQYTRALPKQPAPEPVDEVGRITQHARKRLHERYWHLVLRGKPKPVALIAIARELSGYLWGVAQLPQD